jgi:sugar (pentulose or hexulose) kinase
LFGLARLLWFKEEREELYEKIDKVLTLDDWLAYKLSGNLFSDYSSAADTQFFDIKKGKWSEEIIEIFDLDPEFFPMIIYPGNQIGYLKNELISKLNLKPSKIPIIKSGGDTQANLVGMGAIHENDIGISLGTTAPLHLVIKEPFLDDRRNFWATYHSIKGKYLIEANTGQTGKVYNWFKEGFFKGNTLKPDQLIDKYISEIEPGSDSTFAFLGPQRMNVMNQETIQRGFFVFNSPSMILEKLPTLQHFSKALLENIAFGIHENHTELNEIASAKTITYCSGGMAKSSEFCQMLADILNTELFVPVQRDAAFIGAAIQSLIGLRIYDSYESLMEEKLLFDQFKPQEDNVNIYKNIYNEWKNLKMKVDDI